jgi:hypothetical protein
MAFNFTGRADYHFLKLFISHGPSFARGFHLRQDYGVTSRPGKLHTNRHRRFIRLAQPNKKVIASRSFYWPSPAGIKNLSVYFGVGSWLKHISFYFSLWVFKFMEEKVY